MFDDLKFKGVWFSPDGGGGGGGGQQNDSDADADADVDKDGQEDTDDPLAQFTSWLETQPEEVKKGINKHTKNLVSALQKERKSAAKTKALEKSLKELQEADDARRKQAMTKEEQLENRALTAESRASTSETELRKLRLQTAIEREAVKLNFADPEDAHRLVDPKELEIDDEGNVTGAKEALKDLVDKKPYLVAAKKDAGDGVGTRTDRSKRNQSTSTKPSLPKPRVSI